MLKLTADWSYERIPGKINSKQFHETLLYTLAMKTESFNWSREKKQVKIRTISDTKVFYFAPAKGTKSLKESEINTYLSQMNKLLWRTLSLL